MTWGQSCKDDITTSDYHAGRELFGPCRRDLAGLVCAHPESAPPDLLAHKPDALVRCWIVPEHHPCAYPPIHTPSDPGMAEDPAAFLAGGRDERRAQRMAAGMVCLASDHPLASCYRINEAWRLEHLALDSHSRRLSYRRRCYLGPG